MFIFLSVNVIFNMFMYFIEFKAAIWPLFISLTGTARSKVKSGRLIIVSVALFRSALVKVPKFFAKVFFFVS